MRELSPGALNEFHERVCNFRPVIIRDFHGGPLHVPHQSIEVIAGIGDADNANRGPVPQFASVQFGDRNIEAPAQLVFQAAYHLTPVFQRLRSFNVQFEREKGNQAKRLRANDVFYAIASAATFSVTKASITSPALMSP